MARFAPAARFFALATLAGGGAAGAEVTPEEVWAEVRAMLESYGQTLTVGSEAREGGDLVVRNLVVDVVMPEDAGSASATLDELRFANRGDGSVAIEPGPQYRVVSVSRTPEGEAVEMTTVMTHEGLSILVSGDPEDLVYDYEATRLDVAMDSTPTETVPEASVRISAGAPRGLYTVRRETTGRALEEEGTVETLSISADMPEPESDGRVRLQADLSALGSRSSGFLPDAMDAGDVNAALKAGLRFEGELTYQATTFGFDGAIEGAPAQATGSAGPGTLRFDLTPESFVYDTEGSAIALGLRSAAIPVPELQLGIAQSAFRVELPVAESETDSDFGLITTLRGVTLSESVWALFDPMGKLSRDPATVALDLGGTGRWLFDIFDPAAAAALSGPPGEVTSLKLNELELSVAGAALTGTGAFTFDNENTAAWGGMPAPDGSVDLKLTGGNALLDTLVAMGFVPEEQAMGARMMLGLFARPGAGKDELVSTIEVTPEGQVLANGQRLR